MSQSTKAFELSREVASDMSAKQFFAVKLDSAGKLALGAAPTDEILGVLQNTPTAGQTGRVKLIGGGTSKVHTKTSGASGAIAINDRLTISAEGKFEKADAATDRAYAIAMEASSADGTIIEARLCASFLAA